MDKKISKKKKNEFYFIISTKKKSYKEDRRIWIRNEWNFYLFRAIIYNDSYKEFSSKNILYRQTIFLLFRILF